MSVDVLYIGIDNGVSGALAGVHNGIPQFLVPVPTFSALDFTKEAKHVTRIDYPKLLSLFLAHGSRHQYVRVVMERPLRNPRMFMASLSAAASFEATRIALQQALPKAATFVVDSKRWQKEFLPSGLTGAAFLKKASAQRCDELYPGLRQEAGLKDGDALLMAAWAERAKL